MIALKTLCALLNSLISYKHWTLNKASSLPLVDPAPLVSQGDGDGLSLAETEVLAVVMVIRCDPAHPHRGRVLSGKHSH